MEADSRFMEFLKPLIGQEIYIPAEGTTGKVLGQVIIQNYQLELAYYSKMDNR
jgi:hypothetical protein